MTYTVIGRAYGETAKYYTWDETKMFPFYEQVAEEEWKIEADTMDEASKWLANNHPDMYMGANIIGEKGDFKATAVPCGGAYDDGDHETIEARIAWVKRYVA